MARYVTSWDVERYGTKCIVARYRGKFQERFEIYGGRNDRGWPNNYYALEEAREVVSQLNAGIDPAKERIPF